MNLLNGHPHSNYIRDRRRPLKSSAPSGLSQMGDHSLGFTLALLQTVLAVMLLFFLYVSQTRAVDVRIKRTPADCSLDRPHYHQLYRYQSYPWTPDHKQEQFSL